MRPVGQGKRYDKKYDPALRRSNSPLDKICVSYILSIFVYLMSISREAVLEQIEAAPTLYHRLVLVVADSGSRQTRVLRQIAEELRIPFINVNLEISRRMLDLTGRQRALQLPRLLREVIDDADTDVVFLDKLEILFDVDLQQDPLRLLRGLSRNKTIVASWNGAVNEQYMTYATPEHPEYRRYPVQGFLVVGPELTA